MDTEIARVGREMYKAFSGLNEGFEEVDMKNWQCLDLVLKYLWVIEPLDDFEKVIHLSC